MKKLRRSITTVTTQSNDEGSSYPQNIGKLLSDYIAQQSRRQLLTHTPHSSYSSL